jgi:molybdopterin-guanine dinucleotide biosynthesis protein A
MAVHGVVLAGGRSSRMGRDKALIEIDGVAKAAREAAALGAGGCERVWCQGGDAAALGAAGLDVVPDGRPSGGPLAAIADALATAAPDAIVVAACDLVDLDPASVAALLAVSAGGGADIVAASDHDGPHLLCVVRPSALAALNAALDGGVRSYRQALDRLGATTVELPSAALRNVNTPADLPGGG